MSDLGAEFASCGMCRFRKGPECRKKAPAIAQDTGRGVWPLVALDEWCGDYRRDPRKSRGEAMAPQDAASA